MAVRMDPQRFDELVSDALDLIPPQLAAVMDNVVVLVADRDPDDDDLLGLYEGVALTERDSHYAGSLPDTITIYRDALLDICDDDAQVVDIAEGIGPAVVAHQPQELHRQGPGYLGRSSQVLVLLLA